MENDWDWDLPCDLWTGGELFDCEVFGDVVDELSFEKLFPETDIKSKKEKEVFRPFRSLGAVEFEVKRMRELINKRLSG